MTRDIETALAELRRIANYYRNIRITEHVQVLERYIADLEKRIAEPGKPQSPTGEQTEVKRKQ